MLRRRGAILTVTFPIAEPNRRPAESLPPIRRAGGPAHEHELEQRRLRQQQRDRAALYQPARPRGAAGAKTLVALGQFGKESVISKRDEGLRLD